MFCITCGHQLPDRAKFCSQCGNEVGNESKNQNISDNVISNSNVTQVGKQFIKKSDIGCVICDTSGKCTKCTGLGWTFLEGAKSPIYGNNKQQCFSNSVYFEDDLPDIGCFGTGKCLYCQGTGFKSRNMFNPEGHYKADCECGKTMYMEGHHLLMYKLETPSMTEVNVTSLASEDITCDHCHEKSIRLSAKNWKKITMNEYQRMKTRESAARFNMEVAKCITCGVEYLPFTNKTYCTMCEPWG